VFDFCFSSFHLFCTTSISNIPHTLISALGLKRMFVSVVVVRPNDKNNYFHLFLVVTIFVSCVHYSLFVILCFFVVVVIVAVLFNLCLYLLFPWNGKHLAAERKKKKKSYFSENNNFFFL